jgi:hypothetical protein
MMCGECNSFMAKARGSVFFSEAAKKKCDMCIEAAQGEWHERDTIPGEAERRQ